jgi:two-component system nitrate/nitrite response regulator NarL
MSNPKANIAVLSERAIFRDCLVCFLRQHGVRNVVGAARLGTLARRLSHGAPDLVFVDLAQRSGDAQETVHNVRVRWPKASVVALGTSLQLGANAREATGCIEFCRAHARDVVSMAASVGRKSGGSMHFTASAETKAQKRRWDLVTGRERQVLYVLACGADNLKTAAILGISERTVKAHIAHLFAKFGVENRTELSLIACRAGLHCPSGLQRDAA